MKAYLIISIMFTVIYSSDMTLFEKRFFPRVASISASGEAGVTQISDASSSLTNPSNLGFISYSTTNNLYYFFDINSLSTTDKNPSNLVYTDNAVKISGKTMQTSYFPRTKGRNFKTGFSMYLNSAEYDTPTLRYGNVGTGTLNIKALTSTTSASIALYDIVSFGLSLEHTHSTNSSFIKYFEENTSSLGDSLNFEQEANSFSVCFGIGAQYKIDIKKNFYFQPALGGSVRHLGNTKSNITLNSIKVEEEERIPVKLHYGGRLTLGSKDLFALSFLAEQNYGYIDSKTSNSLGLEARFLPLFDLRAGYLKDDESGGRDEWHGGFTIGYKGKELHNFLKRRGTSIRTPKKLNNLHILYSFSYTDNRKEENVFRDGQQSHQLTFAVDFNKSRKEVTIDEEIELDVVD